MTANGVSLRREGPLLTLVLDSDDGRHAWDFDRLEGVASSIRSVAANDEVGVVLLDSAGDRIFSAGADLQTVVGATTSQHEARRLVDGVESLMRAIEDAPQVVIAVIGGAAIGAGLEIACACDIRLATANARFAIPAAGIGVVITKTDVARLVAVFGAALARDILLGGRSLSAEEAAAAGAVWLLGSESDRHEQARAIATRIAGYDSHSLSVMKRHLASAAPVPVWDESASEPSIAALARPEVAGRVAEHLDTLRNRQR